MQTYARWGEGTVKHLERLGVLDKNLLAVHTVWLTDEELELFRKREVKISHNPASAMRVLVQPHGHGGRDVADEPDPQGLAARSYGRPVAGHPAHGDEMGGAGTA